MEWAGEWSKHCAILFYKTTDLQSSDIRVDFNQGTVAREAVKGPETTNTICPYRDLFGGGGGRGRGGRGWEGTFAPPWKLGCQFSMHR